MSLAQPQALRLRRPDSCVMPRRSPGPRTPPLKAAGARTGVGRSRARDSMARGERCWVLGAWDLLEKNQFKAVELANQISWKDHLGAKLKSLSEDRKMNHRRLLSVGFQALRLPRRDFLLPNRKLNEAKATATTITRRRRRRTRTRTRRRRTRTRTRTRRSTRTSTKKCQIQKHAQKTNVYSIENEIWRVLHQASKHARIFSKPLVIVHCRNEEMESTIEARKEKA